MHPCGPHFTQRRPEGARGGRPRQRAHLYHRETSFLNSVITRHDIQVTAKVLRTAEAPSLARRYAASPLILRQIWLICVNVWLEECSLMILTGER